jgi:hypothetical protein
LSVLKERNRSMPRVKELVRLATLRRHTQEGQVAEIHILDEGDGFSVKVLYKDWAEGAKVRYLTGQKSQGRRKLSSTDTAWKLIRELQLRKAQICFAEDEETLIRDDNADNATT